MIQTSYALDLLEDQRKKNLSTNDWRYKNSEWKKNNPGKHKNHTVTKEGDFYRKVWHYKNMKWFNKHISLLETYNPGYVHSYGAGENNMWITCKALPGKPASEFKHTVQFVIKVYKFCLEHIKKTKPYAHGDWVLSNIIVDGDTMRMCDWDSFGYMPKEEILKKLQEDTNIRYFLHKYLSTQKKRR